MKVILQQDVKDVGRAGELVNVSQGFARNFLFPRKLAVEATEKRMKEWDHLKLVSAAKVKKALAERHKLLIKSAVQPSALKCQPVLILTNCSDL